MSQSPETTTRRGLLKIAATGGVALSVSQLAKTDAKDAKTDAASADDLVLSFKMNKELNKIGGSQIVDSPRGKLIVARIDENSFVALSAICTHKNCEVEYLGRDKEFFCPCHRSRFALDGRVLRGPAKVPLARYDAENALVVHLKPEAK